VEPFAAMHMSQLGPKRTLASRAWTSTIDARGNGLPPRLWKSVQFIVAVPQYFSTTSAMSKTREGILKKLTMTLTAALLVLGTMAMSASAQTQAPGAASFHAQIQKATPIVKQAACRGRGPHCAPGWTWTCGPFGCACRPCF
jgi:hypothetical protein